MPRGAARVVLWVCCGFALAGCGNREKAELALAVNGLYAEPSIPQAMQRAELAQTLAMLGLSREQAAALREWAATDGVAVRREVAGELATLAKIMPDLNAAAEQMLKSGATSIAQQEAVLGKLPESTRELLEGEAQPVEIGELVASRLEALKPLAEKLSDRQRLVLLGHWRTVEESVSKLLLLQAADKDEIASVRDEISSQILQARGYDASEDDWAKSQKVVDKAVAAVPVGQANAAAAEAQTKRLFAAAPVRNAAEQATEALATLGSLLSLEPAAGLLELVP
ncbi:MAG: hypothetical protein IT204_07745 [Fimbriimonadaceae bacterium]|nr:hypothetical protein [Fimbriimonadaceae bacterium]